ncbi:glycoside hydrolase family 130 protein [Marinoscillum pacificum]|uniref:glycoside hydrolase family 130 protein n=1 Tax=Marinoscillum pacificum TaxID=392723 RepID=UPI002157239D|nr:glycoside hydrolase family 130 protein [Marinoscillum pacificum]
MDISRRFQQNPILVPNNVAPSTPAVKIECLLNPGVFRFNNKTWLLVRVAERPEQEEGKTTLPIYNEEGQLELLTFNNDDPKFDDSDKRVFEYDGEHYLSTLSHLRLLSSEDGIHFSEDPAYGPVFPLGAQETFGIEDCRVSQIEDTYYLTYTKVSPTGVGVGLITTKDWKNYDRKGMIFPAHNKDCALFEEPINGKYFALHRPSSPSIGGNYIWIAESPDLEHWGNHQCIATSRKGYWDSARVGAGAAPIKTEKGWLEIYHGADENHRYCLGALLLDLNDPSKVLARSEEPIMEPNVEYEQTGFFGNVVFTNGHLVDGDKVTVYYGASDEVICGAELSISEILKSLGV